MANVLFTNVRILDGSGGPAWAGEVMVQGVKYLGVTPMEALVAATRFGGEIMLRGRELGQIREGWLADLLLVDGDPVADIALLQDPKRLLAVMKDGRYHKEPELAGQGAQRLSVA